MKPNFTELLIIQEKVDAKIIERAGFSPSPDMIYFAMLVEFFEFSNTLGSWKWWKKNHKLDLENTLDELADIIAFFLAYVISTGFKDLTMLDTNFDLVYQEYKKFTVSQITTSIAGSFDQGVEQPPEAMLIAAIAMVDLSFEGITWDMISEAYLKKSQINIKRQEENY